MRILILADHYATGGGAGTIARLQAEELSKEHEIRVLTAHLPTGHVSRITYHVSNFELDYPYKLRNYIGLYHPKAISTLSTYLQSHHFDLAITHNIHWNWSYSALDVLAAHGIKTIHVFHDVSSFTNNTKLCDIPYSVIPNLDLGSKNKQQKEKGPSLRERLPTKQSPYDAQNEIASRNARNDKAVEYSFEYHYPEWKRIREWWGGVYNPFRQQLIQKHLARATKTVAVSNALADALLQNTIRVDSVIHNGLSALPTNHYPLTTIRGNSLLMVGRLNMSKGFLQAVDYLEYLKSHCNLTPELRIAGNEKIEGDIGAQKILRRAKDKRVLTQIKFLGWMSREQLHEEFSSCMLMIVPSICFDSFPTVILEAMQYGKPVVATVFGGAKEIIQHGITGYIEDPFDIPAFADRIHELLSNPEKASQFGTAGFERLRSGFSLEQQTNKLLSLVF